MNFRHKIGEKVTFSFGLTEYTSKVLAIAVISGEVFYKVKYRDFKEPEWVHSYRIAPKKAITQSHDQTSDTEDQDQLDSSDDTTSSSSDPEEHSDSD